MPPRYQSRPTDLLTRVRNEMDALGRPGMAGTSRLGSNRGRGGGRGHQSVLADLGGQDEASAQGQLLILSATGASIDSGGDYVTFDAEVYRHGFDGSYVDDQTVQWPTTFAGGVIQVELAWDTFEGGGRIEIEVDGVVPAWGLLADADEGQVGWKRRSVHINAGQQVKIKITHSEGSGQTADVWVEFACADPADGATALPLETLWLETLNTTSVTSTSVLSTGGSYRFVITGNYDPDNTTPTGGQTVLYPTASTTTGGQRDAEVADDIVGNHYDWFTINMGSGAEHIEPTGGPYTAAAADHSYEYLVTGEGSVVTFAHGDNVIDDNNGRFRIDIYQEAA